MQKPTNKYNGIQIICVSCMHLYIYNEKSIYTCVCVCVSVFGVCNVWVSASELINGKNMYIINWRVRFAICVSAMVSKSLNRLHRTLINCAALCRL